MPDLSYFELVIKDNKSIFLYYTKFCYFHFNTVAKNKAMFLAKILV